MVYHAAVTFELPDSLTVPPRTARLDITASNPATAAARAIRGAKKLVSTSKFDSLVVVLEKAVKDIEEPEADEADADPS